MAEPVALEEWRETRRLGVPNFISEFYERIARLLTNAIPTTSRRDGDFYVEVMFNSVEILVGIEVKGMGDSNPLRIEWEQFESHKGLTVFPYDAFCYLLFSYPSKESRTARPGKPRRRLARKSIKEGWGTRFFVEKTNHFWILPLPVIEFLKEEIGFSYDSFPAQEIPVLELGRESLSEFAAAQKGKLFEQGWRVREGTVDRRFSVGGKRRRMRFSVTTFVHDEYPQIPLRGVTWE